MWRRNVILLIALVVALVVLSGPACGDDDDDDTTGTGNPDGGSPDDDDDATGDDDTGDDDGGPPGEALPNPIALPDGFSIRYYAKDVDGARSMTLGENGTLFVGTRGNAVYAVTDDDGDHVADTMRTIATGLNSPNGVAFKDGSLYVAEISRVIRYDGIESRLDDPPSPVVVRGDYPADRHHGWKFIAFGPGGKLYVPVGAPCNVCEADPIYSSITRIDADGGNREIVAHGVRNTVGFAWHPVTGELWFTDNGRDRLGDNVPPDELNRLTETGQHFGFPYCHGGDVLDPTFGGGKDCADYAAPAQKLGPHVAALGMRFYEGGMFPEEYQGQIFIAEHGSWNRSEKIGYRVTLVRLNGSDAISYETFASGWLIGQSAWGRPVDVLILPDGSMLVSDDAAGAIYRISYRG